MRILILSHAFPPSIGGTETAALTYATEFSRRGYEIVVATATPGGIDGYIYKVVRQPSAAKLVALVLWADLVWQNNVSLRTLWPLLLIRRPVLVSHHSLPATSGRAGLFAIIKRLVCRRCHNVFVSQWLKTFMALPGHVIPGAYDERIFRVLPGIARDRDIIFVGRLVRYKGADILIDAIARLAARGLRVKATVVGAGPEAGSLQAQAAAAKVSDQIAFTGYLAEAEVVEQLNHHKIIVVPSRKEEETFGLVAVEGIACGCVVVASNSAGLPEAGGRCGLLLPHVDPDSLADALNSLLAGPNEPMRAFRHHAPDHLARFKTKRVIDEYEAIIRAMVAK